MGDIGHHIQRFIIIGIVVSVREEIRLADHFVLGNTPFLGLSHDPGEHRFFCLI